MPRIGKGPAPGRGGAVRERLSSSSRSPAARAGERPSRAGWPLPRRRTGLRCPQEGAAPPRSRQPRSRCRAAQPGRRRGAGPVEPREVPAVEEPPCRQRAGFARRGRAASRGEPRAAGCARRVLPLASTAAATEAEDTGRHMAGNRCWCGSLDLALYPFISCV